MAGRTPLSSEVFRQQVSFTLEQTKWLRGPAAHPQGFAAAVRQAIEDQRTLYDLSPVMVEKMDSEAKLLGLDRRRYIQHLLNLHGHELLQEEGPSSPRKASRR
ncbi:MAG: hypothetical protein ACKVPX_05345 [Myxococcaceae bacterium]